MSAFPVTSPVKFPVTLPLKFAVIVPALKFPELSRNTIVLAVLEFVAVVALFATFPVVDIVASLVSDIAAPVAICVFVIVLLAILVLVIVSGVISEFVKREFVKIPEVSL
ncbi:MAG: hypothetical protein ACD_20C00143G0003 [uncultured bacterium]|nr:MAG: hypothetical protein ACD_20C00143G0003 [uncultured bacterium]